MLTYEALLAQARFRNMPVTKARGILREYLQILVLKEIYKSEQGKKLFFTGGTYLRLVHNLKRFSEDLDFNTNALGRQDFESVIKKAGYELKRLNLEVNIRFQHWNSILSARLAFPAVEKQYNIISKFSKKPGIIIKVETNRPKWKIKGEAELISGFGEMCLCLCSQKSALFADKIDALNIKTRIRHLYDIMFMLSHKFPVDTKILKSLGITKDPLEVIEARVAKFTKEELRKQAESLRLFLFEESEADLIINAHSVLPSLIERYKC